MMMNDPKFLQPDAVLDLNGKPKLKYGVLAGLSCSVGSKGWHAVVGNCRARGLLIPVVLWLPCVLCGVSLLLQVLAQGTQVEAVIVNARLEVRLMPFPVLVFSYDCTDRS